MSLSLQFVGMRVNLASDAPNYIRDISALSKNPSWFDVVAVKLYHGCEFPTYDLVDSFGEKLSLNGMYLDFTQWLPNKRPVFPVVIQEQDNEIRKGHTIHEFRHGRYI
jgi:hypothetical protein